MKYSEENVFRGIPVGPEEADLVRAYLAATDWTAGSRRGFIFDLRKLATWFVEANREPFRVGRVTTRDVTDFRDSTARKGTRRGDCQPLPRDGPAVFRMALRAWPPTG